jgi:4-amino-4-deoxy-L-arabinose transferase-like glycosyltransferase
MTRSRAADVLFCAALMVYILIGTLTAPVHADEFMQMALARDVGAVLRGDFATLRYTPPVIPDTPQHLRLLNGPINKTLIGLTWALVGRSFEQLPGIYAWELALEANRAQGNVPTLDDLNLARLPSAVLTALGAGLIFLLGWRVAGRPMAYPAAFLYAIHPVLLLNGRRAMMEGALLCCTLLVILAAVRIAQRPEQWRRGVVTLGLAMGLAVCAKHTGIVVAGACFVGALWVWAVRFKGRALMLGLLSGIIALGVFALLNPPYWNDPLGTANATITARTDLLAMQTKNDPAVYHRFEQRVIAAFEQPFISTPQYYEAPTWKGVIDDQIARYEDYYIEGIQWPRWIGWLLSGAAVIGTTLLGIRARRDPAARILCLCALASFLIALTIPLAWQRYYLPGLPVYILCVATIPAALRMRFKQHAP